MFRRILKWTLRIVALLVIVLAIFLVNLIWFRPWSLNLFYEKVFAQVLLEEPELLSSLGLVERFGITGEVSGLMQRGTSAKTQGLVALNYNVSHAVVLDVAVAAGLSRAAPDLQVMAGMTVRLGHWF